MVKIASKTECVRLAKLFLGFMKLKYISFSLSITLHSVCFKGYDSYGKVYFFEVNDDYTVDMKTIDCTGSVAIESNVQYGAKFSEYVRSFF